MLKEALQKYRPFNKQEERDKAVLLQALDMENCFSRENLILHFTASAWITDQSREHVLMAYHRLYDSWAWTGGHADGEEDLLSVALREANEETGVHAKPLSKEIFSVEVLTGNGHEKRGVYVPSHLHMNVTYLLEGDIGEAIRSKADENKAVAWFLLDEALEKCSEPWMAERVYSKLNEKLRLFRQGEKR